MWVYLFKESYYQRQIQSDHPWTKGLFLRTYSQFVLDTGYAYFDPRGMILFYEENL
jgi:hypothetical protein